MRKEDDAFNRLGGSTYAGIVNRNAVEKTLTVHTVIQGVKNPRGSGGIVYLSVTTFTYCVKMGLNACEDLCTPLLSKGGELGVTRNEPVKTANELGAFTHERKFAQHPGTQAGPRGGGRGNLVIEPFIRCAAALA